MKESNDKTAKAGPVELGDKELGEVAGGYELKSVRVTSYQLSAASGGAPDITGDGTPDIIVGAGPGAGPHIR